MDAFGVVAVATLVGFAFGRLMPGLVLPGACWQRRQVWTARIAHAGLALMVLVLLVRWLPR